MNLSALGRNTCIANPLSAGIGWVRCLSTCLLAMFVSANVGLGQQPIAPTIVPEQNPPVAPTVLPGLGLRPPVAQQPVRRKPLAPVPFLAAPAKVTMARVRTKQFSEPQVVVNELLNKFWTKKGVNRDASSRLYQSTRFKNDPAVLHAYTLNRMQHNRMKEARGIAETLTTVHPANVNGWILKIWLEGLTDNYDQALIDMRSLQKKLAQSKLVAPGSIPKTTEQTVYRRLGRMIGYLQGPVSDKVNQDTLDAVLQGVTDGLEQDLRVTFEDQRSKVIDQFQELAVQNQEFADNESRKLTAANDVERRRLTAANANLENRINQISPQLDQLRENANRQSDAIRQQATPLESRLSTAANQADALAFDLRRSTNEFFFLQDNFPGSPLLFSLSNQIRNQENQLRLRENDANLAADQLRSLQIQLGQVQSNLAVRSQELNSEVVELDRILRKNNRRLGKVTGQPKVASGKLDSRAGRIKALTTYDPFPFALYRQELVETLLGQ